MLLPLLLAVASCSAAAEQSNEPYLPDEVSFEVNWKPDTKMLGEEAIDSWLEGESAAEDGMYVFTESAELAALAVDDITLIPGMGLFQVVSTESANGTITLQTTPASLLDAAEEGDLSWDIAITQRDGAVGYQPTESSNLAPRASRSGGSVDFEYAADGYEIGVKMSRTEGARPSMSFEFSGGITSETEGTTASMRAKVEGTVKLRARGNYRFAGGEVLEYNLYADDVELDLSGEVIAEGQFVLGDSVEYPTKLVVPFAVGPLPFYFAFGTTVELNATLMSGQSVKATGTLHYEGDIGINGEGLRVTETTSTGTPEYTGTVEDDISVTAAVLASLSAPRLELGAGVPQAARFGVSAGIYVDLRTSLGLQVKLGASPCEFGVVAFGAYFGGEAKVFGLTFNREEEIAKDFKALRGDQPCD
jgi:hypothetical protein